jgi:hypothetical protein
MVVEFPFDVVVEGRPRPCFGVGDATGKKLTSNSLYYNDLVTVSPKDEFETIPRVPAARATFVTTGLWPTHMSAGPSK